MSGAVGIITALAALVTAMAAFVSAVLNRGKLNTVNQAVKTSNGTNLGALIEAAETRRLEAAESEHKP